MRLKTLHMYISMCNFKACGIWLAIKQVKEWQVIINTAWHVKHTWCHDRPSVSGLLESRLNKTTETKASAAERRPCFLRLMRLVRVKWDQCWSSHPFSCFPLHEKILRSLWRQFSGGEGYVIVVVSVVVYRLRLQLLQEPNVTFFLRDSIFQVLLSVFTGF